MNKHRAYQYYKYTRRLRWQYLLVAAGITGIVCVLALRSNSQQMAIRRDTLYAADRDNGDVQGALSELQRYVTAHMNTSLTTGSGTVYPPIQLQYTYQRLVEQSGGQPNNQALYTEAQAYCQAQNSSDFSGRNRVPCIQQYVKDRGNGATISQPVSDSLYKFDFVSPRWSPDLAGWSLFATILLAGLAVVQLAIQRIFKHHK